MSPKFWMPRILKFVVFAALFIVVAGYATMHLWNWLVPELFHGPSINLGQTYGLLILSRLLLGFRGGRGGPWAAHHRRKAWMQRIAAKMEHLSPEDREKLRAKMRNHCGPSWMRNRADAHAQAPSAV